mmetsp:Transcript_44826/g.104719  ORF Transcript_44826/g.104719 Transcript_44826/m.104719 type:complete len:423 (+) Transcript_44826:309-1577(+)
MGRVEAPLPESLPSLQGFGRPLPVQVQLDCSRLLPCRSRRHAHAIVLPSLVAQRLGESLHHCESVRLDVSAELCAVAVAVVMKQRPWLTFGSESQAVAPPCIFRVRLVALLEELSEDGRVGGAAVITPRVEAAAATTPLITDEGRLGVYDPPRVLVRDNVRVAVAEVRALEQPRRRSNPLRSQFLSTTTPRLVLAHPPGEVAAVSPAARLPPEQVHLLASADVADSELQLVDAIDHQLVHRASKGRREGGSGAGRDVGDEFDVVLEDGGEARVLDTRVAARGEALERAQVESCVGHLVRRAQAGVGPPVALLDLVVQVAVRGPQHKELGLHGRCGAEAEPRGEGRAVRANEDGRAAPAVPLEGEVLRVDRRQLDLAPARRCCTEPFLEPRASLAGRRGEEDGERRVALYERLRALLLFSEGA